MKRVFYSALLLTALNSGASTLPFLETFDGLTNGLVNGQNDWVQESGIGTAKVQSAVSYDGSSRALEIRSETVSHTLSSENTSVWVGFQARVTSAPGTDPVVTNANTSIAFFVNTNLHLVVYNGKTRIELSTLIATNIWTRFDVYCDYSRSKWLLNINGTNVAKDLGFYASGSQLESLLIANNATAPVYFDELAVQDTEPAEGISDSDTDGLPDWWELRYFGNTTGAVQNATGSNGVSYLQSYIAGLDPANSADFLQLTRGEDRKLRWAWKPGRQYDVYWTSNLTAGFTRVYTAVADGELEDSEYADRPAGFYQLRVHK